MSDLDCYHLPRIAQQWLLDSPFEQSAVEMGKQLAEFGYTSRTIVSYLSGISHLAHWADAEGLQVAQISNEVVEQFVQIHLPTCRCAPRCQRSVNSVRAAVLFWQRVACSSGLVKQVLDNFTPVVRNELAAFRHHLTEIRGLQPSTCDTRVQHVSDFLMSQFAGQPVSIEQLKPTDIMDYVMHRTKSWKPGSIKVVCGALSSYLYFKAVNGTPTTKLVAALPKVAQWRQASLPKALSVDDINTLLNAFDQSTRGGQRDYAIARCYVDLGLRTAEVVRLKLDDINWCQGVVHIRSKGARVDALPLPKTTGEAIARYLEHRDKEHATRALFLRLYPPFDRAATADTIRGSLRNAAKRCGLSGRLTGPHKLRHTLAIRLINSGVSLKEISDLMRHRDLDTTTIYAKVDMNALSTVTSAWPEKFS
jgi:site-specific recombinase XerD